MNNKINFAESKLTLKIIENKMVVASRGKLYAIAKKHPDDEWDVAVGVKLAVERLLELEEKERKKDFVPADLGTYFYVASGKAVNPVFDTMYFKENYNDNINLALGNCFRTREEAEANINEMRGRIAMLISYAKDIKHIGDKE